MSASAFVIDIMAILIGWPTLKLVVALTTRPLWKSLKRQRDELLADQRVTELDRQIINGIVRDAFGGPFELLAPAILSIALPILAWRAVCGHDDLVRAAKPGAIKRLVVERCRIQFDVKGDPFVFSDPRFFELADRATDLAFTRYPVSTFLSLAVVGLNAPALFFSYGFGLPFWKLVRDIANASELQTVFIASSVAPRRGMRG